MIIRPTSSPSLLTFSPASDARLPVIGWNNIITISNISATGSFTGFPDTNLANPSTHLYWISAAQVGDYFIRVSNSAAETLNYVGLAQHNFGSAGFTLTVYGASSASPADLYAITDSVAVTNDKPIIFQFAEQAPATIYLRIQGLDSPPSQYASCAVMYVGLLLTMERSVRIDVNHTPINLGTVSNVVSGMSESGQFVGRIVRNQYQESKADFYYFTDSWYRDSFDPFVISAVDNPFFIAWAPDDWPEDVGYCWLTKDPKPEMHLPTEAFIVSLEMRGIA